MLATDVGRIPVVDGATRKLQGLIARKDLLRLRSSARSSELERRPYLVRKSREEITRIDGEL
jgi:CBS domain-containing protein